MMETKHESSPAATVAATEANGVAQFVAINHITCEPDYRERFETLFRSRAHAIDRAPGFQRMIVLRPDREGGDYLVVSYWTDKA
jgi:heme-degrading monooxygenase HmoA